jgi:hypothetical protein
MPVEYIYQDSAAINAIAPELIQTMALNDPIFGIMPIREHDQSKLRWTMKDNYRGLMAVRGYNGQPTRVLRPGENMWESDPGVFGEFMQLDEQELTERSKGFPADMTIPMDVSTMVRECQATLTTRQVQLMKELAWLLAITHSVARPLAGGGIGYTESFSGQTLAVATGWSNLTTATPLRDLQSLQILYGRGTSNDFGSGAIAWMNTVEARNIMGNRNAADLGGVRAQYGQTAFNSIEETNKILLGMGAAQIRIWDDSYQLSFSDTGGINGTFPGNYYGMYIPDGTVLVQAKRPGNELPGEFMWTRHMINGGGTKPYAFTRDFTKAGGPNGPEVPPRIEIHQGFNGGPVIERPSQLVTLLV